MTVVDERRLHGIAVYNPDLLSKQELVAQFVARRELFAEMVADLRRPKFKQHQLIVGHRGMGKTTLLRRLRYAVEDDPKLSSRWIALAFPEEQYNVSRLSDLYLNCIDALGDALERTGRQTEAEALDEAREELPDDDEGRRAAAALDLLLGTARRLKRRLLLLVDNLDLILDRLKTDHWTLRELLSREDRLLLIGATPFVIGATYEYDAPFYDFFRVHELRGLSFEETAEVLATLAREMHAPDVERLVREEPARIRTLHVLAGGNPRTIVLLFSVLAHGTEGDVRSDLEKLLDQATPLYKARFEALPAQAQQVVDALAIHWDPISASELAEELRLDVNIVSSQLNRLAQQGVVERVPYDPSTKTGFQIAERFFNIWYLMRASRRVRRRLMWLVQFLRLFYGLDQLQLKARDLLRSSSEKMPLRHAELCLAVAEALAEDSPTQFALESRAIQAMLAADELRREIPNLFDLDGADAALRPVIDRQTWARNFHTMIDRAPDKRTARLLRLLGASLELTQEEKVVLAHNVTTASKEQRQRMLSWLKREERYLHRWFGTRLANDMQTAVLSGYLVDDEMSILTASEALNLPVLELISSIGTLSKAKLLEIATTTSEPLAWSAHALILVKTGRTRDAQIALRHAYAGEPGGLAQIAIARAEHLLGHHETALILIQGLISDASLPQHFLGLADAFEFIGERNLAYSVLDRGLSSYADQRELLQLRAQLLRADGRYADAQAVLEKLIAADALNASARVELIIVLVHQDKLSDALQLADEMLQQDQLSLAGNLVRIQLMIVLGRHSEATCAFAGLSLSDSSDDDTRIALFVATMLTPSWEDVLPVLQQTLPRAALHLANPQVMEALLELTVELVRQGHAHKTADLLDELTLHEPLRPLKEALRIRDGSSRDALNRLAPELRDLVTQLVDAWQDNTDKPESGTKKKNQRTNTTRERARQAR